MAKKYSINWEDDEAVSFEVDGVTYESLDDVPKERDRNKLSAMMDAAADDEAFEEVKFDEKEFEELRKAAEDPTMERWVLGGFTAIAVVMLLITAIATFSNIRKIAKEESAPGRVVDVVVRRELVNQENDIVRDYYYPVVEFVANDGHKRTAQLSEGSDSPYYEKGDEITVRYDPDHPLDARIKSASSNALMWVLPVITGILGVAFLGAVLVVRRVMATEEKPQESAIQSPD
jgi:succinate dehydrogenase hydrophobic anchor subunit